jgi:hypothetical protein
MAFAELLDGERGFTGCCVLACARRGCGCSFCAYCLHDGGTNAHAHEARCALSQGTYAARNGFERAQWTRRRRMLLAFIQEQCPAAEEATELLTSLARELSDLGLSAAALLVAVQRGQWA